MQNPNKFDNFLDWIEDNVFFWFQWIVEWINYGKEAIRIILDTLRDMRTRWPNRPLGLEAKKAQRDKQRGNHHPNRPHEERNERTNSEPVDHSERTRDERVEQSSV